jgi:uncharacterized repeat protein (TIGR01451 family)
VRNNTAVKCVIFLALVAGILIVPFVLASGTRLTAEGGTNITLNKTANFNPVNASTNLTYNITITIANLSQEENISNLTLTDIYPADVIFVSSQPMALAGTGNTTFILGNITRNLTIQVNITVMVRNITNGSVINNTANISFFDDEGVVKYNLTTTQNTTVNNPPLLNFSNISITKTDNPDPVTASTNLTYQINVSNTGNGTAYNVTVNDTYPAQVIYLTALPAPVTGTNNAWYFNLTWGQNISINITVLVLNITNGTVINNSVNVTWQNETSGLLSRIATQNTTVNNPPAYNTSTITVTKTGTPNPVGINTWLNYTITVSASGNGTSFNVTVNDTYPSQLIFDSAQPTPLAGTNNSWILGNLTPGTIIKINITMNVTSLADGTVLTNTVNTTYQNETNIVPSILTTFSMTVSNPPGPQPGGSNGGGGGGGGGYRALNRTNTTIKACFESWTCGDWSDCENNQQSRECIDLRACKTTLLKPKLSQSCTIPAPKPAEPQPAAEETAPAPETSQEIYAVQESPMPKLEKVFYGLAILALIGLLVYLGIMHKRSKK